MRSKQPVEDGFSCLEDQPVLLEGQSHLTSVGLERTPCDLLRVGQIRTESTCFVGSFHGSGDIGHVLLDRHEVPPFPRGGLEPICPGREHAEEENPEEEGEDEPEFRCGSLLGS